MKTLRLLLQKWAIFIFVTLTIQQSQAQSPAKTSGYIPVNGLKVYYETYGEGEPLVLLHGAYMTIELNWGQLIPELAKTRKVVALELQGHGRTADTQRALSYEALASDVAGVLEHLGIDKADVVGYSFGATVALQMAIQNPEMINKLVIISSTFKHEGWLPEARAAFLSFQPEYFDDTPLKTVYDSLAPDPGHWYDFVRKMMAFDTVDYNLGEKNIHSIKAPTLLVMGDNDGVELQHKMNFYKLLGGDVFGDMAGLPPSQLAIVPGATHVSLMMDTQRILSLLNPFLTQENLKTSNQ